MPNQKFSCASCGNKTFKGKANIRSYKDFIGAICAKCGTKVTDAHVRKFAAKEAEKIAKDVFRGLK